MLDIIHVPFRYSAKNGDKWQSEDMGLFVYDPHNSIDAVEMKFPGPTWLVDFEHISCGMDIGGDVATFLTDEYLFMSLMGVMIRIDRDDVNAFLDEAAELIESFSINIPVQRAYEIDRFLMQVFS